MWLHTDYFEGTNIVGKGYTTLRMLKNASKLTCPTWLQWLEIKPTDSEKNKAKKKKLQKSYKSKLRFHKLDMETKNRQDSWLNFRKGKGAKKKVLLRSPPCFLLLSMKFWWFQEERNERFGRKCPSGKLCTIL